MKKNLYVSLLLIIFALTISGCGKKTSVENKIDINANEGAVSQDEVVGDSEEEINTSILGMLGKGRSLHCTFSVKDEKEGTEQTGDFYIDGKNKKFRSEAEATVSGQTMKISVKTISDGVYMYSWNNLSAKSGFKMKMDESEDKKVQNDQGGQDLNQDIKFRCRNWKVDNSMFALPAGIQFIDMDKMMENAASPAASSGVDLCAICSQIPDASQKSTCQKTNCK